MPDKDPIIDDKAMKTIPVLLVLFIAAMLTMSAPAYAIDWDAFQSPSNDLKTCFLEHINPKVLAKLSNGRPEKKGLRKKAKKAYEACQELIAPPNQSEKSLDNSPKGEKVIKSYLGTAPMYKMTRQGAQANLIFFNGGPGWWGNLNSKNFLIRERESFSSKGMNVFLFPNTEKKLKMSYADRLEEAHISRIRELVKDIRSQNSLPIYLAGISRGTVSVGKFVSLYGDEIDGAILISGIYFNERITKRNDYSMQEVIGTEAPTKILVLHHENDSCKVCQPSSAKAFYSDLKLKDKKLILVSGGQATGNPHGPFHHHGFEGVESTAVGHIVDWVTQE